MKKIIYVGNFSFPLGNAAGKRVYANGKILEKLGYETIFIGTDNDTIIKTKLSETKNEYDNFDYYNFPYPKTSLSWIKYYKIFKFFKSFIEEEIGIKNVEMIIYYGSPSLSLFIKKLINYSNTNDIKVVSDCVDWLTVKTNNPLFDFIKWADNTYQKAYLNKKVDGVITISKYLENYYKKNNLITVVIPPLSPVVYKDFKVNDYDFKHIIYAGIPFRKGEVIKDLDTLKDRIDKTIILLYEAKKRGANFKLSIFGFTKTEYLKSIPSQNDFVEGLEESIIFYGEKPNKEVTEKISKADFTILYRDVNRDTMAGFPTKVSESISYGTPVITTKTGDLDHYIIEGSHGYFLDLINNEQAINKLTQILLKEKKDILTMKKECINSDDFAFMNYIDKLKCFINLI